MINKFTEIIISVLPLFSVLGVIAIVLWFFHWFLIKRHSELGNERKFPRQLVLFVLTLLSLVAIILVLPITESSRNQLIGLIGLLISAILALSSTTIVANLMAGILLRITKPFRIGDFIRVGDHFGRVAERGLFDTEIQSEKRELIAIPNTYLISNTITTIRSSGTILSTELSLGYSLHYSQIESLLIKAAEETGLEEPFVHIMKLGDYSITYRVSGFLAEIKWLITARSNLNRKVLDALHNAGIEIVSPSFMNQRQLDENKKIIPRTVKAKESEEAKAAEDIMFDKAQEAEHKEGVKLKLEEKLKELENTLKEAPDEEKKMIKDKMEKYREKIKVLMQTEQDSETSPGNSKNNT